MSRQLGSLHRSNSHPTNLNTPIPIIQLFAFPPPNFPTINISSSMNSDTFEPIPPNNPFPSVSTPSYASQVTPTYSPFHSDRSSNNSPDTPQIS